MIDAFGESTTQKSLLEGHAGGTFRSMLSTASVPPSISDVNAASLPRDVLVLIRWVPGNSKYALISAWDNSHWYLSGLAV